MRMLSGTILMLTGAVFIAAWMLGAGRNNFPFVYGGILHLLGIGLAAAGSIWDFSPAPLSPPAQDDPAR